MSIHSSSKTYAIITPVKDEEKYIPFTLKSVIEQTHKPSVWILVDDGSSDNTAFIIQSISIAHPFIRLVNNPRSGSRRPGKAIIHAFNYGLSFIKPEDYSFIIKLDADLSLEKDYFSSLLERFDSNKRLGIASGVYYECQQNDIWMEVKMPAYHAAGACKVIRRECFQQIGGFIPEAGWDTVDEIRANCWGWQTRHFRDLTMRHHKPEGSVIGPIKTSRMHGEIFYLTGGDFIFFILKVLRRIAYKPYVLNALALLYGYLYALCSRKKPLVTKQESRCYKSLLRHRMRMQINSFFQKKQKYTSH